MSILKNKSNAQCEKLFDLVILKTSSERNTHVYSFQEPNRLVMAVSQTSVCHLTHEA